MKKNIQDYILQNSNKVKINSKDIMKGDIFIALDGSKNHGSIYIDEAMKKGAIFILTNKFLGKIKNNRRIIIVDNVLDFLLVIAKEKRKLFKGNVIGITGSVGKTSLKENLKFLLEKNYRVSASIKSYNNYLGTIISLLNLDLDSDYGIFEMGTSNFNEIRNLTLIIQPSQIIITNIHPTHLEKLKNTKNIAKEKSDIFHPKYNRNTEVAILSSNNKDEKNIIDKAKKLQKFEVITFGKKYRPNIEIINIDKLDDLYSKINIKYLDKKISLKINNSQIPRISNMLVCLGVFIYNKISISKFISLNKNLPLIEGRGLQKNLVFNSKKIKFIDESYNASPYSMKITVDYFSELKVKGKQKKILILGDMKELGKNSIKYHKDLLSYIHNKKIKNIIICGELMQIALDKNVNSNFVLMLNTNKILDYLKNVIKDEDIVLIKGSNSSITNNIAKKILKSKGK